MYQGARQKEMVMAHVRKEIRSVLSCMGFDNMFHLEDIDNFYKGGRLVVTICGWEPHPDAIQLKKRIERRVDGHVSVNFEMRQPLGGHPL
jgi:hypothetical protein